VSHRLRRAQGFDNVLRRPYGISLIQEITTVRVKDATMAAMQDTLAGKGTLGIVPCR